MSLRIQFPTYRWDHIILIRDYEWRDPEIQGNEIYKKMLGHKYDFIHACPDPDYVTEIEYAEERYPIVHAWDYLTGSIYSVWFRRPNRPEE